MNAYPNYKRDLEMLNVVIATYKIALDFCFSSYTNLEEALNFGKDENDNNKEFDKGNEIVHDDFEVIQHKKMTKMEIFKTINTSKYDHSICKKELKPSLLRKKIQNPKYNLRPDCIRKRIKTHFLNYLLNFINKSMAKMGADMYLFKLPYELISDAKYETNRELLRRTVKDLFLDEQYSSDIVKIKKNKLTIIFLENQIEDEYNELKAFINLIVADAFSKYIKSENFQKDCLLLELREGQDYAKAFVEHSNSFIEFYLI